MATTKFIKLMVNIVLAVTPQALFLAVIIFLVPAVAHAAFWPRIANQVDFGNTGVEKSFITRRYADETWYIENYDNRPAWIDEIKPHYIRTTWSAKPTDCTVTITLNRSLLTTPGIYEWNMVEKIDHGIPVTSSESRTTTIRATVDVYYISGTAKMEDGAMLDVMIHAGGGEREYSQSVRLWDGSAGFRIEVIGKGRYWVRPESRPDDVFKWMPPTGPGFDWNDEESKLYFDITDNDVNNLDFRAINTYISGTLKYEDGTAINGETVYIGGYEPANTKVTVNGRFRLDYIANKEKKRLWVQVPSGHEWIPPAGEEFEWRPDESAVYFDITSDDVTNIDFKAEMHSISGRVMDYKGDGIEGATVSCTSSDWPGRSWTADNPTDVNGKYTISGLYKGIYTVEAEKRE